MAERLVQRDGREPTNPALPVTVTDLPDALPMIDPLHGFMPPFAVDQDDYGMQTVGVFPTIPDAARKASRLLRREPWLRVEIVDKKKRRI